MFNWVCPRCGRENSPAYTECPDCKEQDLQAQAELAAQQPVPVVYPPQEWQAPPQQLTQPLQQQPPIQPPQHQTPPPQPQYAPQQQQPQYAPQPPQYAPAPQQLYAAPQPQYAPPQPQYAPQQPPQPPQPPQYAPPPPQYAPQPSPPQYAPQQQQYPPPPQYAAPPQQHIPQPPPPQPPQPPQQQQLPPQQPRPPQAYVPPRAPLPPRTPAAPEPASPSLMERLGQLPTGLLMLLFAAVFLAVGAAAYFGYQRFSKAGPAGFTGGEQAAAAVKPKATSPLQKYIEVVGIRLTTDAKKRPIAKFLVVNHASTELNDLGGVVTLWASTSRSEEDAIGSFTFKVPNLKAYDSKELSGPLNTKLKIYELPDWQNATAEVQITSPQQ